MGFVEAIASLAPSIANFVAIAFMLNYSLKSEILVFISRIRYFSPKIQFQQSTVRELRDDDNFTVGSSYACASPSKESIPRYSSVGSSSASGSSVKIKSMEVLFDLSSNIIESRASETKNDLSTNVIEPRHSKTNHDHIQTLNTLKQPDTSLNSLVKDTISRSPKDEEKLVPNEILGPIDQIEHDSIASLDVSDIFADFDFQETGAQNKNHSYSPNVSKRSMGSSDHSSNVAKLISLRVRQKLVSSSTECDDDHRSESDDKPFLSCSDSNQSIRSGLDKRTSVSKFKRDFSASSFHRSCSFDFVAASSSSSSRQRVRTRVSPALHGSVANATWDVPSSNIGIEDFKSNFKIRSGQKRQATPDQHSRMTTNTTSSKITSKGSLQQSKNILTNISKLSTTTTPSILQLSRSADNLEFSLKSTTTQIKHVPGSCKNGGRLNASWDFYQQGISNGNVESLRIPIDAVNRKRNGPHRIMR